MVNDHLVASTQMLNGTTSRMMLVYTHIPKCGGTTLDRIFIEMFGPLRHLRIDFAPGREHRLPTNLPEDVRNRIDIVSGHFGYARQELEVFRRKLLYIASVRDPVDRIISFYKFMSAKYLDHKTEKAAFFCRNPNDVIQDFIRTNHPIVRNQQCSYLGGIDFETAKNNVEINYLFVSNLPRIQSLLDLVLPISSVDRVPEMVIHKKSSTDAITLDDSIVEKLRELTGEDRKLVTWLDATHDERYNNAYSKVLEISDFR